MRADVSRYAYMFAYGGVYADLDYKCLKPLDELLHESGRIYVHNMSTNDDLVGYRIPNSFMASPPGHPFWQFLLNQIYSTKICADSSSPPEHVTGPNVFTYSVDLWNIQNPADPVSILSPSLFPLDWSNRPLHCVPQQEDLFDPARCEAEYTEAFMITFWTHSWG